MRARGVAIRDSNGKAICIEGTTCDITASKEAIREATPQESEKNLRLAAFPINNPNPVLATDQWGNITYMNPAAERLLSKIGISEPLGFLPENHAAIARRCLECGQGESQIEVTVAVRKAALQEQRVFSWSYHPVPELNTVHLYGIDITERQWAEEQLLQAALHDGLTGLPNRTLFIHRLEAAIARAKKNPSYLFAVLFLDLDRFKVVNDSLGHVLGDRFLIAIARRLETCLRPGDVVARMGGDEFTILLCGFTDISVVNRFAERILKELSLPINLNGYEVFTTASIGITIAAYSQKPGIEDILARPYEQPEELLRDADLAMYRAKAEGKARYVIFDSTMHKRAVALLQMENELRRALNESGKPVLLQGGIPSQETSHPAPFVLYYQPIVALDTGRIAGFEALVRWIHPERGLISPSEFIPVAEESGLIVPLGNWVLLEACRQLRQWQEKFPAARELTISVNLSGKQLSQPDLLSQIDSILQQTGIDAYCLKLEITESVLMDNAAAAVALLEQLRARNIGLCIDDFGTGYSSLSYLHRFPINTLKIDRSFVVEMGGDNENSEIARAIVMLAHNLGMYVVAEGVETEQHLVQLWAMQCEYAQGYFFSKPLDSKAAEELIAAEPQW
ncbi:MAG TPA: EAL domain-containing protein [Oscillatoriaceae cyanobacterium M7585_C2015_266]|nr:EAL domain-containing protein [Oscillatoriaceae cyanobacterium M7585_C2015_266]